MRPHVSVPHDLQRCPFFARDLGPLEAMPACPGYEPLPPPLRPSSGEPSSLRATTCWHLTADTVKWFRCVPLCHHPEAERIVQVAREVAGRV
ncbi:MAG TPA: hypothetical protein VGL20_22115 [Candidatus Dormibacteraeota bacterium]